MCKGTISASAEKCGINTQSNRSCYIMLHTKERNPQQNIRLPKVRITKVLRITLPVCTCIFILFSLISHYLQCADLHAKLLYQHRIDSHHHSPVHKANQLWDTKTRYKNRNSRASTKSALRCLRIFLLKPAALYLSAVLFPQPSLILSS